MVEYERDYRECKNYSTIVIIRIDYIEVIRLIRYSIIRNYK